MASTVTKFLVHLIMRTQEVIKCRTFFIRFPHVQRLPVRAANWAVFLAQRVRHGVFPMTTRPSLARCRWWMSGFVKLPACWCEDEPAAAFSLHKPPGMFTAQRVEGKPVRGHFSFQTPNRSLRLQHLETWSCLWNLVTFVGRRTISAADWSAVGAVVGLYVQEKWLICF